MLYKSENCPGHWNDVGAFYWHKGIKLNKCNFLLLRVCNYRALVL